MFTRAEFKQQAKTNITGNWSYLAGLLVIIFVITFIAEFAIGWIPFIGLIITLFITIPFEASQIILAMKVFHKENILVGDIFQGFKFLGKVVGLQLWMALWVFLWTLLFFIPGVIKLYSYSMSLYCLLNNPTLTIREAMKESMRITKGYKLDLFVLELSWIGWSILSAFTCFIGILFLSPYMTQTTYIAFRFLKQQADGYVEEEEDIVEEKLY